MVTTGNRDLAGGLRARGDAPDEPVTNDHFVPRSAHPLPRVNGHRAALLTAEELRTAVTRNELVVHYQPVVDLWTGAPTGVEALVRWDHPDFGLLRPAFFVPMAERRAVIGDVSEFVLGTACAQLEQWHLDAVVTHGFRMAVNVSTLDFSRPALVERVRRMVSTHNLNAGDLLLELTETVAIAEAGRGGTSAHALRELGVELALDDFGTGYANLALLHELQVDELKIDRTFVADLDKAPTASIVRAVVGIARGLGLRVVGEGVERQEQATRLADLGCHEGQGFLWSAARPAAEISALLAGAASFPAPFALPLVTPQRSVSPGAPSARAGGSDGEVV